VPKKNVKKSPKKRAEALERRGKEKAESKLRIT